MRQNELIAKLNDFVKTTANLHLLFEGVEALKRSTVLDILKEYAKPIPVEGYPNFTEQAVANMYKAIGYNNALEDILYFKERFLDTLATPKELIPDFGAKATLLASGNFLEEELNDAD